MNVNPVAQHQQSIIDQFSRQAVPFAEMPAHSDDAAFELLFQIAGFKSDDRVLDVGCGPGIVTCAVARRVAEATGLDLTPAMIAQARQLQQQQGLANLTWAVGDMQALPFADETFSCVLTRYTFHHLLSPQAVLQEMARVTRPGGQVVLIDVAPAREQRAAYDQVERWRDPSHTQALVLDEMLMLGERAALHSPKTAFYRLEVELERLLAASFPNPGDDDKVRQRFAADLDRNELGVGAHLRNHSIWFSFPIAIVVWKK